MAVVNIYLTFNGNCEQAFNFYKSVFGGEFPYIGRFKDMPPGEDAKLNPGEEERIMHVSLPISKETMLMGSDTGGQWATGYKEGNNFTISMASRKLSMCNLVAGAAFNSIAGSLMSSGYFSFSKTTSP